MDDTILRDKLFNKYHIHITEDDPAWLIFKIHHDLTKDLIESIERVEAQKEDLNITHIKKTLFEFSQKNQKSLDDFLNRYENENKKTKLYLDGIESIEAQINSATKDAISSLQETSLLIQKNMKNHQENLEEEMTKNIDFESVEKYKKSMIRIHKLINKMTMMFIAYGLISYYFFIKVFKVHEFLPAFLRGIITRVF